MEYIKEKLSCDLLFTIPGMKVTLKQLSETVLKTQSSIHRYFAKRRKIGIFYLVAASRILQYCFCEQPY